MSQIVTHSNILNPHGIMVMPTTARHSDDIVKDLLIADGYEVILSKNSIIMSEPFEIVEGDIINVMFVPQGGGGGKSILGTIAMIAVAVFAPQLAMSTGVFGAEGALAGYGLGLTGFTGSLVAGGIMLAGSLLINAVFGAAIPTSSLNMDSFENSVTYSWDESYNQFKQGIPVPKVFGTHKITPPLISKYIETIGNKQYFNGLYAVNDGLISNLTDIKINDESIDNFDNVTIEVRNGANVQGLISNFDNTFSDRSVNKKLSTSWADTETAGNQVTGLNVVLVFPRGLFYANDSGGLSTHSVKVVLEYSSDNVNWTRFGGDTTITGYWYYVDWEGDISKWDNYNGKHITSVSSLPADAIRYGNKVWNQWYYTPTYSLPYTTISGAETSTIRKTFKLNYLAPSKYYVRARFYEDPPTTSRYGSDCYLEYITEEVGDDFTYPNTALISVRALATDQLSGGNPKISCIVSANSSNPALICKQMLLEAGISSDRILPSFTEWEAHCNARGYACNIVFDASMNLRKALDIVSTLGRASVVQFGSKFEAIMDRAEAIPVQSFTFGMGNILKDSFKQQFLPILDRANVIEMTYYDANLDYDATIVEVSNTNYDSVAEENRTAVTLVGCTSRTQAIKHARYMLNCNRYLTETITLEADKDSLVCKYGDIVRVSHDVPQYGFSGRIISCTTTSITLDREIPIIYGVSYYVQIRDGNNNVYEHPVHWKATGDYDTFDFVTPISTPYSQYDNYAFGEIGKASKLYRVLKIGTSSDLTRTLSLLEYNEDVYNDEGYIDVPEISVLGLSNLRATDYIRYAKDGSIETVMQLAWNGVSLSYTVSYKKSADSAYQSVKVFDNFLNIIAEDTLYNIIVTDAGGKSVSINYSVVGKTAIPDDVTSLVCTESGNVFTLSWDYVPPVDFKEFVVYLASVEIGRTTSKTFSYKSLGLTSKSFTVKAIDTTGNLSLGVNVTKTASSPNALTGLSVSYGLSGITLSWNKSIENDFSFYEVRDEDSNWGTIGALYKGVDTSCVIVPTTNKTYYVRQCDLGGNYSTTSSILATLPTPSTPSNITHTFSDTTSSMAEVTLNWDDSTTPFGISYYKVAYGAKNVTIKASEIKVTAAWEGDMVFSITAYDSFGFTSTISQKTITKSPPNPPINFRFQVIDNNVLFYWDEPTITTLPITSYELKRGTSWDTAELIGKKSGGFTTVFESVSGNFTYWIASIDSDNRYSTPTSVTATVSQPPDFILNVSNTSTFNGTKNNMLLENGYLLANIDMTKTWATHFSSMGWTTVQNQIDAGHPIFIQPTLTAGYYEETVDLGTVLASSRVTVTLSGQTLAGVVSTSCDISVSTDGVSWTTYTNMFQVFATNFRYYKFKINVSATTTQGLYKITNITSVLDSKLKNDGGSTACLSTDAGGTTVNFNVPFVDITSITVTPLGTTPITAMYDFVDTPNPTSFKILLFNSSGTRVSGTASWSVKGY